MQSLFVLRTKPELKESLAEALSQLTFPLGCMENRRTSTVVFLENRANHSLMHGNTLRSVHKSTQSEEDKASTAPTEREFRSSLGIVFGLIP